MLSNYYAAHPDSSNGAEAVRRRAFALLELITVVSEEAPLALLCDDVEWADPASTDALTWIFGQVDTVPALCVTAGSTAEAVPSTQQIELTPLSPDAIHALLLEYRACS